MKFVHCSSSFQVQSIQLSCCSPVSTVAPIPGSTWPSATPSAANLRSSLSEKTETWTGETTMFNVFVLVVSDLQTQAAATISAKDVTPTTGCIIPVHNPVKTQWRGPMRNNHTGHCRKSNILLRLTWYRYMLNTSVWCCTKKGNFVLFPYFTSIHRQKLWMIIIDLYHDYYYSFISILCEFTTNGGRLLIVRIRVLITITELATWSYQPSLEFQRTLDVINAYLLKRILNQT